MKTLYECDSFSLVKNITEEDNKRKTGHRCKKRQEIGSLWRGKDCVSIIDGGK